MGRRAGRWIERERRAGRARPKNESFLRLSFVSVSLVRMSSGVGRGCSFLC